MGEAERSSTVVRTFADCAPGGIRHQDRRWRSGCYLPTAVADASEGGVEGGACALEFGVVETLFSGIGQAGGIEDRARTLARDGGIEAVAREELDNVDGGQGTIIVDSA